MNHGESLAVWQGIKAAIPPEIQVDSHRDKVQSNIYPIDWMHHTVSTIHAWHIIIITSKITNITIYCFLFILLGYSNAFGSCEAECIYSCLLKMNPHGGKHSHCMTLFKPMLTAAFTGPSKCRVWPRCTAQDEGGWKQCWKQCFPAQVQLLHNENNFRRCFKGFAMICRWEISLRYVLRFQKSTISWYFMLGFGSCMLLAVDRVKLSEMGILGPLGLENLQDMSDAEATTGAESTC